MSQELDDDTLLALAAELIRMDAAGVIELPRTSSTQALLLTVRSRYANDPEVLRVCQLAEDLLSAVKVLDGQVQALKASAEVPPDSGRSH